MSATFGYLRMFQLPSRIVLLTTVFPLLWSNFTNRLHLSPIFRNPSRSLFHFGYSKLLSNFVGHLVWCTMLWFHRTFTTALWLSFWNFPILVLIDLIYLSSPLSLFGKTRLNNLWPNPLNNFHLVRSFSAGSHYFFDKASNGLVDKEYRSYIILRAFVLFSYRTGASLE